MCGGGGVLVTWLGNVSDELWVVFVSFFFFGTLGRNKKDLYNSRG